jgi:hypothetical protein
MDSTETLRLRIEPGQTFYLPENVTCLRVEDGALWLTENGDDVVIEPGMFIVPQRDHSQTLVSAVGRKGAAIKLTIARPDEARRARQTLLNLSSNRP